LFFSKGIGFQKKSKEVEKGNKLIGCNVGATLAVARL
jgi:hypothetical protein